jgi:hypothetical protein
MGNGHRGDMMVYHKFCFWVDLGGLKKVRNTFEKKGIQLEDEARIPCRLLKASREIGYLAPPVWSGGFCKRRTSWYRKSDETGKFLVVSSVPLDHLDIGNPIIITELDFNPERFPSPEEIIQLMKSREFHTRKPHEWDKVDPVEKEFYQRWHERYRPDTPFDFDEIFSYHSANHANFIDPEFFIRLNDRKVPYSIADSIHVCSSCLEFFNIIGEQWPVKYVVPCIGAVQFAHLPMDRYFEVRIEDAPMG